MDISVTSGILDEEIPSTSQGNHQLIIKPIEKDIIHRICSGQVVLSLAVAMKELVENSIDAGATIIGIHLVEYGSELLEVSDNGSGVSEENWEALALKHYTSKIRQFDDLINIGTLGFRGEALSSLCALSDLIITTKHSSAQFGTKLTYDCNGKVVAKTTVAREEGTTVSLSNLFSTLPVRRKEFMKNVKREFGKLCQMLYAYCLVSKGIKFTCTNVINKSRNTVVATEGKNTVRENIINVFGAKQISCLVDVELVQPNEPILTEYGIQLLPGEDLPFTCEMLISSVTHGSGRSSTDRQFYFINDRPCEHTKLMKLVNEIYKQFNSNQYPFVYMNITTKNLLVDVNVTPDKRQVFLEKEKLLLATIKASLLEVFRVFPSVIKRENLELSQILENRTKERTSNKGIKRSSTDGIVRKGTILDTFKKRSRTEGDIRCSEEILHLSRETDEEIKTSSPDGVVKQRKILDNFSKRAKMEDGIQCIDKQQPLSMDSDEEIEKQADKDLEMLIKIACKLTQEQDKSETPRKKESIIDLDHIELSLDVPSGKNLYRQSKPMEISLEEIRKVLESTDNRDKDENIKVKFRSEIKPENNKAAEEELQTQISKEDFEKMEIIGQFNLGFIITRLNNDLFIIDQHATDEKYNFEQLQMNTVLDSQVLVSPKPLELTAGNESLLIEHLDVFKKNGVSFKIDESASCTKKVALTAIPVNRNFVFGKDDIDEMLFMLQESNSTMCRPSRVRAMLASRACRKSVMIGKALSKAEMRKLVNHMGEIEQPWNCPHGRPTMRHLINLGLIENDY